MRGINGQRREHGPDLREVILLQPDQILRAEFVHVEEPDAVLRQFRHDLFAPADVLFVHQFMHALLNRLKSLGGRQPVHALTHQVAFDLLLDGGHPHLEELVEIGAEDGKKLHALQQRHLRIARLGKHPAVELQPAQLAIQEVRGVW